MVALSVFLASSGAAAIEITSTPSALHPTFDPTRLRQPPTVVTFTKYIQSLRVKEAKRFLTETDNSITAVCFACGFNNLTHFNRVFRGAEGCSPRQYRLANRRPQSSFPVNSLQS
jgi:methylphosphotriester-DNA--protein-cysteine methyltransferase